MKKNIKAFTIIELLLVIVIIGLIFGLSNFDFSSMSNRQKGEIFTNKIVSKIEEARNSALVGKTVNSSSSGNIIPESWKIKIDKNGGKLETYYCQKLGEDGYENCETSWQKNNTMSIKTETNEKLETIRCSQNKIKDKGDGEGESADGNEVIMIFTGKEAYLNCGEENSIEEYYMILTTDRANEKHQINFDSVNSLLEIRYLPLGKNYFGD